MSQAIVTESKLVAIGDAIRQQLGTSVSYTLDEMASAIATISGGGGGGGGDLDAFIVDNLSEYTGSVAFIPSMTFQNKQHIQSVNVPNASYIGSSAFQSCSSLTTISAPQCTKISDYAFNNCRDLSDITFGSAVSIGGYAFAQCTNLSSINSILANATSIGSWAFTQTGITEVNYSGSLVGNAWFQACSNLSTVSCPNATTIGSNTFDTCSNLTSCYFPNVTSTSQQAFYKAALLGDELSNIFPNLTYVAGNAFGSCKILNHIISMSTITTVYLYGFANIGNGNTSYNLHLLSLPNCSILYSSALYNNSYLTSVFLSKIGNIHTSVFYYCSRLSIVDLTNVSAVPLLSNAMAFGNTPISKSSYLGYFGSIYVPASLYAAFTTATNWLTYSARITSNAVPS